MLSMLSFNIKILEHNDKIITFTEICYYFFDF